jgi:hypothetical protein
MPANIRTAAKHMSENPSPFDNLIFLCNGKRHEKVLTTVELSAA